MAHFLSIQQLAEEDRPREKLLVKGPRSLTDSELIAILIGSGNKEMNAVELGQFILSSYSSDLNLLASQSVTDLIKFKGIGEAKAITIVSALELGRRRKGAVRQKRKIQSSKDAFEAFASHLMDLPHEEFWMLVLNRANIVLSTIQISQGGVSGTVVDAKILFRKALDQKAVSIIIAHNHPSGNTRPSQTDIKLTEKLVEAGKVIDIPVLDHLIFTNDAYFSFADEGLLS